MALKNLFDMAKADKYTADGREAIIKAQEAETEDARRTYQIGEISEATGLQKTAQGWKPPKETKFGKVKQNKEGQWGVQTKQGKGSDFLKHKSEKEASRALANYTAGYNTTERSKQDPHSDQARQVKHWDKETNKIRKQNRAEGRAAHAAQFQKPAAEEKLHKLSNAEHNARIRAGITASGIDTGRRYQNENGAKIEVNSIGDDGSVNYSVRNPDGSRQTHEARSREELERTLSDFGYFAADAAPSLSEIVDRVYNIGEISEKTGLQKTANGWRPVKKGAAEKTSRANKEEAIRKDLGLTAGEDMSRFSDEQIESMYQKTQKTPEQQKADFDKSKIGQAVNKGRQEFAAEKTRQKELASKTNAIGLSKENNLPDIPDFKGMESGDYDKKLRAEGWTTGGWEGSGTHASAIFKKGDRTIRVNEGQPGKITSVQEISKPAVEKFDIEKWKTGPKVEKNSKLDWSHGVVGETIPVQGKSAEEKRNLINKYNSVGRLSRIGTKKNSYYNNKHGTFEVAGIDNDNVYIQEERSNGMGSRYMALVTIPLNEVEEINSFHDYGKRNPDTGEESPTRPPLPEDAAPRVLTGDTRIRVRKA